MTDEKYKQIDDVIYVKEVEAFLCEQTANMEKYAFSLLKWAECRNFTPNEMHEYLWKKFREHIGR